MKASRIILLVFGVLLLALGAVVLVDTVKPVKIVGIASWFLLALIVHDGVIAFAAFGVALAMRKVGRRVPLPVIAIVQGALVLSAVFALLVLPEIYKQHLGSKNYTVLPLDYGLGLLMLWAATIVVTVLAIAGYYAFTRRQKQRPSVSQS
jgi:hypothetical protein